MNLERLIFLGATGAIVVVTFAFFIIQRWLHERASKRAQAKAIEEREPVRAMTCSASSRIVNSAGFPRFSGPGNASSAAMNSISAAIMSST